MSLNINSAVAGLPDINGEFGVGESNGLIANASTNIKGVFSKGKLWSATGSGVGVAGNNIAFNASSISPVYGASNTVTPASMKVVFVIRY